MSLFTETEESGQFQQLTLTENKVITRIIKGSVTDINELAESSFKKAGTVVFGKFVTLGQFNALSFYNQSDNKGFAVYKLKITPKSSSYIEVDFILNYQDIQ